jgi:hypothetical protein
MVQQQIRVKSKGLCDYFLYEWTGIDGWILQLSCLKSELSLSLY